MRPALSAGILVAALAAQASPALAQGKTTVSDLIPATNGSGMDVHLFRAAIDTKGFFSVNGADILGGGDISFGLVLDYGHGLMRMNDGHGASFMVDHAFKGTIGFDYGIAGILVIGLSAPVVINHGDLVTDVGPGGKKDYNPDALDSQALGDLALHVKVPILRPDKPIGIAVVAQAGVGVGGTRNFASEPGFFYWPQLVLEKQVGRVFRMAINAGYRGHTGDNPIFGLGRDGKPQLRSGVLEYSGLFTGSLAVSVRPHEVIDLVAESYMTYLVGGSSDPKERPSAEAVGGVKLFIDKNLSVLLGAGPGFAPGFQTAQVRGLAGVMWEPSFGERAKPQPEPPPPILDPAP